MYLNTIEYKLYLARKDMDVDEHETIQLYT